MKKKPNLSRLFSFLLLIVTLGIVLYVGLNGNDMEALAHALANFSPFYLVLCLICWALFVLSNALSMKHFLHTCGIKLSMGKCLHAAMTGIYYCNVTPGATGGQPMEMYVLSKHGVSIGVSGSALAIKYIAFQLALIVGGVVLWIRNAGFVADKLSGNFWLLAMGMIVNFASIGLILLMSISRSTVTWLINGVISLMTKMHLCKNPDATRANWRNHCESFLSSIQLVIRHPKDIMLHLLIATLQLMSQMFVIVLIYHALGLKGTSVSQLITMSILLYITASYVPLPGASGAQEGGFALFFGGIFPDAQLFLALLIWRFFTYYLSVIVGAGMTIVENVLSLRRGRKEGAKDAASAK